MYAVGFYTQNVENYSLDICVCVCMWVFFMNIWFCLQFAFVMLLMFCVFFNIKFQLFANSSWILFSPHSQSPTLILSFSFRLFSKKHTRTLVSIQNDFFIYSIDLLVRRMSVFVYSYGYTKKMSFIIHRTQGRIVSNEYLKKKYAFGTRSKWTQLNERNTDFYLF